MASSHVESAAYQDWKKKKTRLFVRLVVAALAYQVQATGQIRYAKYFFAFFVFHRRTDGIQAVQRRMVETG